MATSGRVTRRIGEWGEQAAAAHIQTLGWQIVDRNWRCGIGELDLVASQDLDTLVFIEVKCRSGRGFGDPLEAITRAKLGKLRELSALWLQSHALHPREIRLDAIGVLRIPGGGVDVTHIRGITS